MDGARLPELVEYKGTVVRRFPAEYATSFRQAPQADRRATPAVLRRLFKTAAQHADEPSDCLICDKALAPAEGRVMIAVETDRGHDIGCVCSDCAA